MVVEIAREDAPIVDGQPVLVGAFGVEKRGTPIPPATRVLRLIVNAIPSNKQQTAIKGDVEQMPMGGEWLHIALQSDEIVLWSSDDIQGCFHVFSLPPAWRRWMILSKPIRVAMPAGKVGVLASNDQLSRGGNAPQPVVSDGLRLIWLALAVIPMGWLSAVDKASSCCTSESSSNAARLRLFKHAATKSSASHAAGQTRLLARSLDARTQTQSGGREGT